jgi:hypothetical protein
MLPERAIGRPPPEEGRAASGVRRLQTAEAALKDQRQFRRLWTPAGAVIGSSCS